MIDMLIATALAAAVVSSDRHDHGLAFFRLTIQLHLPGRETVFELYEVGEGENRTLLVERRIEQLGGESRHDVTSRECSNLGAIVEQVTRLEVPRLYIEGIGEAPEPVAYEPGTLYEFRGFVEHPNGEMGEISLSTNDPGGSRPDPLRAWADDLALVFEACVEMG